MNLETLHDTLYLKHMIIMIILPSNCLSIINITLSIFVKQDFNMWSDHFNSQHIQLQYLILIVYIGKRTLYGNTWVHSSFEIIFINFFGFCSARTKYLAKQWEKGEALRPECCPAEGPFGGSVEVKNLRFRTFTNVLTV